MCVQSEADYRPLMTDVVQSLIPLVKQQTGSRVEILVKEMNSSKEVNLSIKEHLLTSATEMLCSYVWLLLKFWCKDRVLGY